MFVKYTGLLACIKISVIDVGYTTIKQRVQLHLYGHVNEHKLINIIKIYGNLYISAK